MKKVKIMEVIRFLIGLTILGYAFIIFVVVLMAKNALDMFLFALIGTPWVPVFLACITGIYFMFTSKIRWKPDVLMSILAVLSIIFVTTTLMPEIASSDISRNNSVLITVMDKSNMPIVGLEVNVGVKPDPPPREELQ